MNISTSANKMLEEHFNTFADAFAKQFDSIILSTILNKPSAFSDHFADALSYSILKHHFNALDSQRAEWKAGLSPYKVMKNQTSARPLKKMRSSAKCVLCSNLRLGKKARKLSRRMASLTLTSWKEIMESASQLGACF